MKTTDNILIRKVISLPILVLFFLLITGCNNTTPTIFSNPICSPPCWENIEPGITSKQNALNLVNQISTLDTDTIALGGPFFIFDDVIHFGFKSKEVSGRLYIMGDKVVAIGFSGDLDITIGEAFDYLGEPMYIINLPVYGGPPLRGTTSSGVKAINPEVGYDVSYDTRELTRVLQEELSPEINLTLVTYFDPKIYNEFIDAGLFSSGILDGNQTRKNLMPWDGYGNLAEKYPQIIIDNQ